MSGKLVAMGANLATKKMLGKEMDKYKGKDPAGDNDPYFQYVTLPNGKKKKVKKQIPSYIPDHDAKILSKVKSRAYHLDLCLFNFMGIRFGWSAIWGLIPELGDVIDFLFALSLVRKCRKVDGGLPASIMMRMMLNLALDFVIGLVPLLGDLADAAFKCNTKNAALLEGHLMKKHGPQNMSEREKHRSRLEDFSAEDKAELRDSEKPIGIDRPGRTQPRDHGHTDRFGPDLESGRQGSGTVVRY